VVYDPVLDELFSASRGDGARLNDQRIRVSSAKNLETALLGSGFPVNEHDNLEDIIRLFAQMTSKAQGIRRSGASALDLANVAAGRLDGYWEAALMPWDVAAGSLLVREAGGIVADFAGENDYVDSGNVIAASPRVFAEMQKMIKQYMT
jgi:Archaeal fructose-1,6-bisphosphatase and related enzymes of inositol monophosphatase family